MEIFIGMVIGFIIAVILGVFTGFRDDVNLMNQLREERQQSRKLREELENAEIRVTEFAKKIKVTENILNSNEIFTEKYDKIKELFLNSNQDK